MHIDFTSGRRYREPVNPFAAGPSATGQTATRPPADSPPKPGLFSKTLDFLSMHPKIPNSMHFVWVGKAIPQAELLNAAHFAARSGSPSLWTDKPAAVIRTASSLHSDGDATHAGAGALESHIRLTYDGRTLDSSLRAAGKAVRRSLLDVRDVQDAFETTSLPRKAQATIKSLDDLQAQEGAGLGSYARRSDIIRVAALYKEGGVYMDVGDRAASVCGRTESIRHDFLYSNAYRARRHPKIKGTVRQKDGLSVANTLPTDGSYPRVNNDLLAASKHSPGMLRYAKAIADRYAALQRTPALEELLSPEQHEQLQSAKAEFERYGEFITSPYAGESLGDLMSGIVARQLASPASAIAETFKPVLGDQVRYTHLGPGLGNLRAGQSIYTHLTFQSSGPGTLQHSLSSLSDKNRKKAEDMTALAARLNVSQETLDSAPGGGGAWLTSAQTPARAFEAPF